MRFGSLGNYSDLHLLDQKLRSGCIGPLDLNQARPIGRFTACSGDETQSEPRRPQMAVRGRSYGIATEHAPPLLSLLKHSERAQ